MLPYYLYLWYIFLYDTNIYITVYDKENAKRSEDAVEMPPEHAS